MLRCCYSARYVQSRHGQFNNLHSVPSRRKNTVVCLGLHVHYRRRRGRIGQSRRPSVHRRKDGRPRLGHTCGHDCALSTQLAANAPAGATFTVESVRPVIATVLINHPSPPPVVVAYTVLVMDVGSWGVVGFRGAHETTDRRAVRLCGTHGSDYGYYSTARRRS